MLRTLDEPTRRLYVQLLAGSATFGVVFTIAGASLPNIIRTFNWSYAVTGLVLSASALGYFLSTFACGFLVRRISPKAILVSGLWLGAASMLFFARSPLAALNFALNFFIGICQGTIEVVANLEVIHMEQKGQSRLMNLLHAAFSVGAVIGPVAVGTLLGLKAGWSAIFPATSVLLAAMGALFVFTRFPRAEGAESREGPVEKHLLRQPLLLLFTLMLLLYVGSELGVSNWISEYFTKVLSTPASLAALSVSLFWMGLFIGRLSVSFFYRGARQQYVLLALTLSSAAALGFALLFKWTGGAALFIFLAGLGYSAIYPLVMTMVGKYYKSGVAVGTAATGGGIGSFTFPFIIAVLFEVMGLRGGFLIYALINVILACLSVVVIRMVAGRRRTEV